MRKSHIYIGMTTIAVILLITLISGYPAFTRNRDAQRRQHEQKLVANLALTDICLFTEASYLRHPNLADRFVPFQDHPMAISLFPSESMIGPPAQLFDVATVPGEIPHP